ncbi:hypothetical protein GCM10009765_67820 [Fodinicola feengrottensis]|uniref:Uncharacterized protein n=1 Tax=Fodinicola feengrottensis TaxID=435914 RepID=A0ABN2INY4_9ACTN
MTVVQETEATEISAIRTYEAMGFDEAVKMVRAAERLGFGVVLRNAERADEDGEVYLEWSLELLDEVPSADSE